MRRLKKHLTRPQNLVVLSILVSAGILFACQPAATEPPPSPTAVTARPEPTEAAEQPTTEITSIPPATLQPTPPPLATSLPLPTPVVETRLIELEWPTTMRLGDSDVVRLALVPDEEGYRLLAEFP
ncbi:MAG: hypothetical protein R3335_03455, partial [Anaerolineales bacterium]|nr:hypothetical protein [Anaerolineales bacterium]